MGYETKKPGYTNWFDKIFESFKASRYWGYGSLVVLVLGILGLIAGFFVKDYSNILLPLGGLFFVIGVIGLIASIWYYYSHHEHS